MLLSINLKDDYGAPKKQTFKKLVNLLAQIETEEDFWLYNEVVEYNFATLETISFDDYELLGFLASRLKLNEPLKVYCSKPRALKAKEVA